MDTLVCQIDKQFVILLGRIDDVLRSPCENVCRVLSHHFPGSAATVGATIRLILFMQIYSTIVRNVSVVVFTSVVVPEKALEAAESWRVCILTVANVPFTDGVALPMLLWLLWLIMIFI